MAWCSVQTKIEKSQKIKGILNIFGVYDHTNDQMYTHSYKYKTGKQFLDFIKRVDKKYDKKNSDEKIIEAIITPFLIIQIKLLLSNKQNNYDNFLMILIYLHSVYRLNDIINNLQV